MRTVRMLGFRSSAGSSPAPRPRCGYQVWGDSSRTGPEHRCWGGRRYTLPLPTPKRWSLTQLQRRRSEGVPSPPIHSRAPPRHPASPSPVWGRMRRAASRPARLADAYVGTQERPPIPWKRIGGSCVMMASHEGSRGAPRTARRGKAPRIKALGASYLFAQQ